MTHLGVKPKLSASDLRSPYPWFGGKRRVVDVIWRAFDPSVPNFIDTSFGSNSVLLGRPGGAGKIETINDKDGFCCNFWRAIKADPAGVARFADWPVSELDLHARHLWLVNQLEFRERMRFDPNYFDIKIAGWWVWGICAWIGGGWCRDSSKTIHQKRPDLHSIGKGVHSLSAERRPLPHLSSEMGVHTHSGRRTDMASAGRGVHLPSLGNDRGLNGVSAPPAQEWFVALQDRLRRVRVACGDFERVLGDSVLGKGKNVGGRRPCAVCFDLPYDQGMRSDELYAEDERGVSARARNWAVAHGDDPDLRIAFCGYEGEHEFPSNWSVYEWRGARGYAGEDNGNRSRERIWFSPHCLPIEEIHPRQLSIFREEMAT